MAKLCPKWPNCRCIVRGYANPQEPTGCGRKPPVKAPDQDKRYPLPQTRDEAWAKLASWDEWDRP